MSTYFKPPASRQNATANAQITPPTTETPLLDIPEQSIYIFPTPPSLPASPGVSSVFSAPSDFSEYSSGSDTRSRNHSISSFASASRSPIRRRPRPSSAFRRELSSTVDVALDPEIEVWDWTAELGEDVPDEDGVWQFEAEVDRASRWNAAPHQEVVRHRATSRTSGSLSTTNDFIDRHYRAYLRSRTQSNISTYTSLSASTASSSRSAIYTPHPRIHIPLLSFFASILFLDIEDPALRLLSQSTPDSVLFPGQAGMLDSLDADARHPSDTNAEKPHGLMALLTDDSVHSTKALRDGFAVVCDPSFPIPNPFAGPGISAIQGFRRFVGSIWSTGGKVWREVGLSATSSPT